MPRSTNSPASRQRRKKVLKQAAGYRGSRHRLITTAIQAVEHAGTYAYRDRKVRKRAFRHLWVARINAGARANGISYSRFINGRKRANIELDRKVLADLAVNDEATFTQLCEKAKASLEAVS